jgi:hypothetical protein
MYKAYKSLTSISTALIVKFCNTPPHASYKTPKPFLGNCCHSCKIVVLNSSIFWHFGLHWLMFRPIKSHTRFIGFMSGDITGHGIVCTTSCCKTCCTIRALCGLALLSMNIGLSANTWLSKWGTTRGHCHSILVYQITIKNVQVQLTVKGITTPGNYTPTPKSSFAQNVVVLKWSVLLAPNPCMTVGRA